MATMYDHERLETKALSVLCERCSLFFSENLSTTLSHLAECAPDSADSAGPSIQDLVLHEQDCSKSELRADLLARCEAGCELCGLLLQTLEETTSDVTNIQWLLHRSNSTSPPELIYRLGALADYVDNHKWFHVRITIEEAQFAPPLAIEPMLWTDMASQANFDSARSWLRDCDDCHQQCAFPSGHYRLPHRLVNIQTSDPDKVRLCDTMDLHVRSYAALSYCWGRSGFTRTSSLNVSTLQEGIKVKDLPSTIVDAVRVTREMGLRYLWVDSLCIIQDSDSDKTQEITFMAEVYKYASITIVAASAANAVDGFLYQRELPVALLQVPFSVRGKSVGKISLYDGSDLTDADRALDPTEQRAWCLQETVLSRRCLIFSSLYLIWCCRGLKYARRGSVQNGSMGPYFPNHFVHMTPPVFRCGRRGSSLTAGERKELSAFWSHIASEYSSRDMTDPTDKFRAISAIARECQMVNEDDYCAGMWRNELPLALLWKRRDYHFYHKRQTEDWRNGDIDVANTKLVLHDLMAPTWSWLSAPGRVEMPEEGERNGNFTIQITGIQIETLNLAEPLGRLKSGKLSLRGRMVEVLLWKSGVAASARSIKFTMDESEEQYYELDQRGGLYVSLDRDHDDHGRLWKDYCWGAEAKMWALEVATAVWDDRKHLTPSPLSSGLILVSTADAHEFRREGHYEQWDQPLQWFNGTEATELVLI